LNGDDAGDGSDARKNGSATTDHHRALKFRFTRR
jgi:hypothetical protein